MMEKFLVNFRTPIISFCFGVLLTTVCIWSYVTLMADNTEAQKFEIIKGQNSSIEESAREVYFSGAVNNEGVFKIQGNEDILNFVQNNVGFSADADIEKFEGLLGRASGEQLIITVPFLCHESTNNEIAQILSAEVNNKESDLISINTASKSELENLPGIGAVYAERIIQGRPYSQLSDLKKIKGIGDKIYSRLEPLICL